MTVTIDGTAGITPAGGITYPTAQTYSGNIAAATAVATTSGTSVTFLSIPSWVRRITLIFSGVSTTGTASILVQIGSGSTTTLGYSGGALSAQSGAVSSAAVAYSSAFVAMAVILTAADTHSGIITLVNSGTWWTQSGTVANNAGSRVTVGGGTLSLIGTLDRVVISTTDTFDAGFVNILYE